MIASTALKLLRLKPEYFFLGHPGHTHAKLLLPYEEQYERLDQGEHSGVTLVR